VAVDVTVLARNGRAVSTLKAEDFTLLVDGAPRPIMSARLVEARPRNRRAPRPGPCRRSPRQAMPPRAAGS